MKTPKLHPFQHIGAYKLYTEGRFLLADEMGMFKTAQAIFANSKFREKKRNLRTLIVTPYSVRDHWARELNKWAYPGGDVNVLSSENTLGGIVSAKKADWTIVSYPTLSVLDPNLLRKLLNLGFHHVIIDEAHNAKNPAAIRTRNIKQIADQADFLSLLSGSPIPNTTADLYVLMSLLHPDKYRFSPTEDDEHDVDIARQKLIQVYLDRPQEVKSLLHQKMLRRKAEDYLGDHIPRLVEHRVAIPLTGRHLDTYLRILSQDIHPGKKIWDLQKASLDPRMIDDRLPRTFRGKDISVKLEEIDEMVEREMRKKGGKVVIFSDLKEGVVDEISKRYGKLGVVVVTGDITRDREKLREKFQYDPKTRVMVATAAFNEGVELTAATGVIDLTIPWTHIDRNQRVRRAVRPSREFKRDRVDLYTPYTTIPGPQQSIEEATLAMIDSKEKIAEYLLSGMKLSLEELRSYDNPMKVERIVRAITSPNKAILKRYVPWRGIGSERAQRLLERDPELAQHNAELYLKFSMAQNAAEVYVPIIKKLEERGKLTRKVDIACGPGMLGHFLDERATGVDIDPHMIKVGKRFSPKTKFLLGSMHDLPLEDRTADLAVCSLAYQMTEPKQERAKALQEMNRVLRSNGYAIITMLKNYLTSADEHKFQQALAKYGFTVKEHQRSVGPSQLDVYVLQKTHKTSDEVCNLRFRGDPGRK